MKTAHDRGVTVGEPTGGQPAGSTVLMADGAWKAIQQVAVGDLVLSPQPDGTVIPAPVWAAGSVGNQRSIRSTPRGGRPADTAAPGRTGCPCSCCSTAARAAGGPGGRSGGE